MLVNICVSVAEARFLSKGLECGGLVSGFVDRWRARSMDY